MTRNDMAFWFGLATLLFGMYVRSHWLSGIGAALLLLAYFLAPKMKFSATVTMTPKEEDKRD
jgi:hypothetical protein